MIKQYSLKALICISKDLKLIKEVKPRLFYEVDDVHGYVAEQLERLHKDGFKGFDNTVTLLSHFEPHKNFNTAVNYLTTIEPYTDTNQFSVYWNNVVKEATPQPKFPLAKESLTEKRQNVLHMLSEMVEVPGFPLEVIPGKLNTVISPSHGGKTTYSIALAATLARSGKKTLFLTTEESEEAFYERTFKISQDDEIWNNLSVLEYSTFNKETLKDFLFRAEIEEFDFVVIDYIKKSMWEEYTSDHVVMEQIHSVILKTQQQMKRKLTVFTMIQANRAALDQKHGSLEAIQANPNAISIMIDGGLSSYKSADNVVYIHHDWGRAERHLIVTKARRQTDLVGAKYSYDVNLKTYEMVMSPAVLFEVRPQKTNKQSAKNSWDEGDIDG